MALDRLLNFFRHPKPSEHVKEAADEYRRSMEKASATSERTASIADDVASNVSSTLALLERSWGRESKK
jgi:hypothetical protein